MIKILIIIFFIALSSCATVDIEKNILDQQAGSAADTGITIPVIDPLIIFPEAEIRIVEKPVFIPSEETIQAAPRTNTVTEVRDTINSTFVTPQEYSHAAVIYDYHPDWVYEIYCQTSRISNIHLESGELVVDTPFVSDSDRFIIGAGVSYDNGIPVQHIYVKPVVPSIEATLIINTDRRVYHIFLRSFNSIHMPIIRFRYSFSGSNVMPNNYISPSFSANPLSANSEQDFSSPAINLNPKYLSFNYRMTYPLFKKPVWLPELVFDDGSKTYIRFPELVYHRELPSVFENRRDILNYRVIDNVIVIDKLIENITVKIGSSEVTVAKKRGANVR